VGVEVEVEVEVGVEEGVGVEGEEESRKQANDDRIQWAKRSAGDGESKEEGIWERRGREREKEEKGRMECKERRWRIMKARAVPDPAPHFLSTK